METMDNARTTKSQVLNTIGALVLLGALALVIAGVVLCVRGGELFSSSRAMGLAAMAVFLGLTGIGLCCQMRIAGISLALGLVYLVSAQAAAAFTPLPWPRAVEHALFAMFLCWPLLLLWRHRTELK